MFLCQYECIWLLMGNFSLYLVLSNKNKTDFTNLKNVVFVLSHFLFSLASIWGLHQIVIYFLHSCCHFGSFIVHFHFVSDYPSFPSTHNQTHSFLIYSNNALPPTHRSHLFTASFYQFPEYSHLSLFCLPL